MRRLGLLPWMLVLAVALGVLGGCDKKDADDSYTATQYPIVLSHGFLGFDTALGIVDYWYRIVDALENGGATVYVTEVSPVSSSVDRGEQIIEQLDAIRTIEGDATLKFNLIGHSQGGLDIRYVGGVRPDLVASITTVASPHLGVDIFDQLVGPGGSVPPELLDFLGTAVTLLWDLLGNSNPNDAMQAFEFFEPSNLAAFNADPLFSGGIPNTYCGEGSPVTPTTAGPRYNYSWTGNDPYTNALDPLDPLWLLISQLYDEDNDGLVEACSAHFGDVISDSLKQNHLDEVNQLLGVVAGFTTHPTAVYRAHANRLKTNGL